MVYLRYLSLPILLLCCHNIQASSNKNVWIFEIRAAETSADAVYSVTVNLTSSNHECDKRFLGVTLSSKRVTGNWNGSEKLRNLAAALAPCDLRLGGTSADFLSFDPDAKVCQMDGPVTFPDDYFVLDSGYPMLSKHIENITMSGAQWSSFNTFVTTAGWDLLFDVNLFRWTSDGLWDPSNAAQLLNYSSANGIRIPYFQLGNEPNGFWGKFQFTITPETLAKDFKILKNLVSSYSLFANSKLCGPDISNLKATGNSKDYLQKFISAGGYESLDAISFHHYYLYGDIATANDFLDVATLNSLKAAFESALQITRASPRPLPVQLTETASCSGGGAPGLSDRYIAGFLWLDKLGLAAQYGLTRVFRQQFVGGAYGLLSRNYDPTPDYYLSVLFKRLIEGPVFNINFEPPNPKLRVYAHCAQKGIYSPGALVVYYLNLGESKAALSLPQFQGADLDLYLLTPGDDSGLVSRYVKLNGKTLLMEGNQLPDMPPKPYKGEVTVTAQSFGFIVVTRANVPFCVNYYKTKLDE